MSKRLFFAALAGIFLLFGTLLFLQLDRMKTLEREISSLNAQLEQAKGDIRILNHSLGNLSNEITELEAAANETEETPLVDSYLLTLQDLDVTSRTMTVHLRAKLNVKNMAATAEVIVSQDGANGRYLLTESKEDPGWYEGDALFSLEDISKEVCFQILAADEGERRTEELSRFTSAAELLEVSMEGVTGTARYENGLLTFTDWNVQLGSAVQGSAYVNVYLNGELSQQLPITGEPMTFTQACAAGDKVVLRYTARDTWGLTYEFLGQWWKITEKGAERHFPSSGRPTLTWP